MSCGVGHRRGSDPLLLWLWGRPVAVAPIGPLAWELPYAVDVVLKRQRDKKKKKKKFIVVLIICCQREILAKELFLGGVYPWYVEVPGPGIEPTPQH